MALRRSGGVSNVSHFAMLRRTYPVRCEISEQVRPSLLKVCTVSNTSCRDCRCTRDAIAEAGCAAGGGRRADPDHRIEQEFSRRLGHSNPTFLLAQHQRQVLAWLDASAPGEVIAVNGQPGTGKTACEWSRGCQYIHMQLLPVTASQEMQEGPLARERSDQEDAGALTLRQRMALTEPPLPHCCGA